MHKKKNGSYYTPSYLSEFIFKHIAFNLKSNANLCILEPSIGDGSFVQAFNNTVFPKKIKKISFTGVEKFLPELRKAEAKSKINPNCKTEYSFVKNDFLKFQKSRNNFYSIIAGNPPYIKKGLLGKEQINTCLKIHESAKLSSNSVKNLWTSFLVRCIQLLKEDGILSFILPAELLQVKFAKELREFLVLNFQRTEIFTFEDLLFDCKGQDTILLFGYKKSQNPGQFFAHIENSNQLIKNDFKLVQNNAITINDAKWIHHLLPADDLDFVYNVKKESNLINHYCESKPGIVTAANNYFIVNQSTEQVFELNEYSKPIIQRGLFVNGGVVFDKNDFDNLVSSGLPTKILCFKDDLNLTKKVNEYLSIGQSLKLPERYKCKKRNKWFVVPNISSVSEGFFFKRSHHYPKLLKNEAEVLVTDSAYKIEMRNEYNINSLIYSFYNSLTLISAEIEGRYYGGGVLELTPSEFKNVTIPYVNITDKKFERYAKLFKNKIDIQSILNVNDATILNQALGLNQAEVDRLNRIYTMLISKRLRKKEIEDFETV